MDREPSPRKMREPAPIWPDAPRLLSGRSFPPYRFVPGLNPHPTRSRDGHSYGSKFSSSVLPRPDRWRECDDYLFGIDLYHHSYFWESHEAWEGLWQQAEAGSMQWRFLRGLIQNSAAMLKIPCGNLRGAAQISRKAVALLVSVRDSCAGERFMGIDVRQLVAGMQGFYAPLYTAGGPRRPERRPPVLVTD